MRLVTSLLFVAALAYGQQTQPVAVQPQCVIFFNFTAAGQNSPASQVASSTSDNRTKGCSGWLIGYGASGFSALSLVFQSAPDNGGSPGTWVTYANQNLVLGANPNTTTTSAYTCITGYNPWVRMRLASATGTGVITGSALGFTDLSACGSPATTDVNVAEWGGTATSLGQKLMAASVPVVIASDQSALPVTFTPSGTQNVNLTQVGSTTVVTGGLAGTQGIGGAAANGAAATTNPIPISYINSAGLNVIPDYCTLKAVVSAAGSGNTQLVAVDGSKTIRICHWAWTGETAVAVKLVTGTGATCTSSADETATFTGAGGGVFGVIQDYASALATTAAKTLCINLSGASTNGSAEIQYSQR